MSKKEYIIGCDEGSCGYNQLSFLTVKPNKTSVKITIIANIDDDIKTFEEVINTNTVIEQKSDAVYPYLSLFVNNKKLCTKKYYFTNVKVILDGDYTATLSTTIDVDR